VTDAVLLAFASWQERKPVATALKFVYRADDGFSFTFTHCSIGRDRRGGVSEHLTGAHDA